MPTFAGGLGMLAADIMRSAADTGVVAACVTICWQHGYMRQTIHSNGTQRYDPVSWNPPQILRKASEQVTVQCEGRTVHVGAWIYDLQGSSVTIPIIFLDTDLSENAAEDRQITSHLYGGDGAMRLKQEIVLGIGGVKMLRTMGYSDIRTFHMNEGHAAFLTLELLRERNWNNDDVKRSCAFTTHTPVAAGHDVFDYDLAFRIAGDQLPWHIRSIAGKDRLSMTELAIRMSRYTCGVSKVHGEVSRRMFPWATVDTITNGVHHVHWTAPEFQNLYDSYIHGWRQSPQLLAEKCRELPDDQLWKMHQLAKDRLIAHANQFTDVPLDPHRLTIASARRVVSYKRPELLYTNLERLREVCQGKVQIIHAGNAHAQDPFGQGVIQRMIERSKKLRDSVRIVYVPNYNPDLASLLTGGADVWLNTPMRLHEASGTSGMKACVNGVLNFSTLDGWWIEAFAMDPEAGWRIGPLASALPDAEETTHVDAEDLYTQLQYEVIPEFEYENHVRWIRRMKRSIGLIGYFNTHRCVGEYREKAWKH
ncbi:MAG: starch phosphorylase [Candidatus Peregrinibacteria bacterium Greene1014_49]|nr:MAG: starch phosphorylase [Candidatus Peregrinibacteria bacterium Greene1014_49]